MIYALLKSHIVTEGLLLEQAAVEKILLSTLPHSYYTEGSEAQSYVAAVRL